MEAREMEQERKCTMEGEGMEQERRRDGKQGEMLGTDGFQMEMEGLSRNEEFARVVVAVFMSRMNPTLEELDDVKTAVSEAVTNAVIHGYQNQGGKVGIACSIAGNELTVTVWDQGRGIADLKKAMEPMYTTDQSGERSGMGFSFMEAFMDHLEVESCPGKGTTVRMKKRIGG